MADRNIAPHFVNYQPPRLVANRPAQNDAEDTDGEQIAPLTQLPDHLLFQILARLPVRNMLRAAAVSRSFNQILANTELPPPAVLPSESSPWCFIHHGGNNGVLGYDPVSDKWRPFQLTRRSAGQRHWIWNKISSADGLVCVAYTDYGNRGQEQLEVLDPYTLRSRRLPPSPDHIVSRHYTCYRNVEFSTNIWMIDPAECHYKIIVSRSVMAIGPLPEGVELLMVLYIDSYDKVSNTWRTQFWVELPNDCLTKGSSAICRNVLYNIVHSKSLDRLQSADDTRSTQFFVHQYDLASSRIVLPQLIALPCSLCSSPSPVLVNCNDDLILVGFKGRGLNVRAIVVWRFNSRTQTRSKWLELGVMPRKYFLILTPKDLFKHHVACKGEGNLIYFRNIGSSVLVVLDISQMDNGRLRRGAWKKASPYPIQYNLNRPYILLSHHFCYEPRLLRGTSL